MTVSFQNGSFTTGSALTSTSTLSGGITTSSLYNTDYLDRKYDYNRTQESYEISYSGEDAAIETKINNICSYIDAGREDKAMEAYEELLSSMSSQTRYAQLVSETGDDTQLRAIARQLMETELGSDLEKYIRDNAKSNSGVEVQKVLTWNNCDSTSQEDLLEAMCDIDEEEGHGSIILTTLAGIASPAVVLFNTLFNGGKKQ